MCERGRIWHYLKGKGSITSWDAIKLFNYTRLSGVIWVWRDKGVDIKSVQEINEDTKEHWTRYYIKRDEAERAEREGLISYEFTEC